MREFSAKVAFDKATNGQTDIKPEWWSSPNLLVDMHIVLPWPSRLTGSDKNQVSRVQCCDVSSAWLCSLVRQSMKVEVESVFSLALHDCWTYLQRRVAFISFSYRSSKSSNTIPALTCLTWISVWSLQTPSSLWDSSRPSYEYLAI